MRKDDDFFASEPRSKDQVVTLCALNQDAATLVYTLLATDASVDFASHPDDPVTPLRVPFTRFGLLVAYSFLEMPSIGTADYQFLATSPPRVNDEVHAYTSDGEFSMSDGEAMHFVFITHRELGRLLYERAKPMANPSVRHSLADLFFRCGYFVKSPPKVP